MSRLQGKVGKIELKWKKAPQGRRGSGEVEVAGKTYAVSWKSDKDGLWVELPSGVVGYDVSAVTDENDGVAYEISRRGMDAIHRGLKYRAAGEGEALAAAGGKKKSARIKAQMPGKIVRVLVKAGDEVQKGQAVLVMEAMKMENEIRATQGGKVEAVSVSEGQAVETGAELMRIS